MLMKCVVSGRSKCLSSSTSLEGRLSHSVLASSVHSLLFQFSKASPSCNSIRDCLLPNLTIRPIHLSYDIPGLTFTSVAPTNQLRCSRFYKRPPAPEALMLSWHFLFLRLGASIVALSGASVSVDDAEEHWRDLGKDIIGTVEVHHLVSGWEISVWVRKYET